MTSRGSVDREPGRGDSTGQNSWFDEVFGSAGAASGTGSDTRPDGSVGPDSGAPGARAGFDDDQPTTAFDRPDYVSGRDVSDHDFPHREFAARGRIFGDEPGTEATAPLFPIGAVPPPYPPDHSLGHQPSRPAPGSGSAQQAWSATVQPVPAPPPISARSRRNRRGPRAGTVVGIAALTAVLIGGGAGYGGMRLAQWQAAGGTISGLVAGRTLPTVSSSPSRASSPSGPASGAVSVVQQVLASTVTLRVSNAYDNSTAGTGSGMVLDSAGHILTNDHVVQAAGDGGRLQVVFADGRTEVGELIGRSPSYDLAVVQVTPSSTLSPVRLGSSEQTQIGETAIAVGSPLGLGSTVTQGIISAKDRPVAVNQSSDTDAPSAYIDALQTDAPVDSGNSGGPLVNAAGEVIGVNSAILHLNSNDQSGNIGLGFAIPIDQAMVIAAELVRDGHATYPVMGANVVDAGPGAAGSSSGSAGVLVQNVQPGQPAGQAGLVAGDVITAIDDRPVHEAEEFIVALRGHRPGDTVTLSYQRGGLTQQARVTLGSKEG